ncbi:MAG: hypothetical protein LBS36_07620 [Oscillospiraceae bacterium]|jgi:hypothetical protein|nr:hypothetical protein [Oscillospiraceae bacterium]
MAKKRNCRMTDDERQMHERAVRIRKMTDAQICEFIDRTYGKGMEEGSRLVEMDTKRQNSELVDGSEHVKTFIAFLKDRVGTGNRIGNGAILQLNRELESAQRNGIFGGQQ